MIYSSMSKNRARPGSSFLPPFLLLGLSLTEILGGCENTHIMCVSLAFSLCIYDLIISESVTISVEKA